MRGCLSTTQKVLAYLLAGVFVVTLPLSVGTFNLGRVAFSPERMTALLADTIAETGGFRRLVIDSLAGPADPSAEEGGLDLAAALSFLSPPEREYLGEQLAPPGWVESQLGVLVGAVYDWIDNDQAQPVFTVDVSPIKVALLSGGAADLVEVVVDSWPPCSVREVAEMSVDALFGQDALVLCEPPEPLRSGLVGILNASLTASLRALPNQLTLGDPGAERPASPDVLRTKEQIRRVRFLAGWSWILSPALLVLLAAVIVRSWRGWGLWWGLPLMLGGLLTVITMVGVRLVVGQAIGGFLTEGTLPAWIGSTLQGLASAMLAVTFRRVVLDAALLGGIGILILAVGRAMEKRRAHPAPAGAPDQAETLRFDSAEETSEDESGTPPSGMFG